MAADCAAQRAATALPHSSLHSVEFGLRRPTRAPKMPRRKPGGSKNRKSNTLFLTASACRPLPRAAKPLGEQAGDSANRATRSRTKFQPKAQPSAARKPITVFPPEEQARPQARPSSPLRVRLTAAPLSLRRCRSALKKWTYLLLNVARGNSCRIGSPPTGKICLLSGRATDFFAQG